jgi:hypothetical protein
VAFIGMIRVVGADAAIKNLGFGARGGGDGALEVIDPLRDTASEDERDAAMLCSVQRSSAGKNYSPRVATSPCSRVC